MTIKMILAIDQGGAIGWSDGRLPWKLKGDMWRFKELTTGGIVVMGFNTFKSLNRPVGLPNRRNIVLTRKHPKETFGHFEGDVEVISDLSYINRLDNRLREEPSSPTIWIIGGATVYEEALHQNMVDEIYLTLVHADSGADVKLATDLVAWKRFILTERLRGIEWEPLIGTRQWDGDVETSYLHFTRV